MKIETYRFGSIRIDGTTYTNDLKIISSLVVPDWWRKTGHRVDADELSDIIEVGPAILVLGTGEPGNLRPAPGLSGELEKKGISLIAEPTARAVETFNRLHAQQQNVAAGFHLTC